MKTPIASSLPLRSYIRKITKWSWTLYKLQLGLWCGSYFISCNTSCHWGSFVIENVWGMGSLLDQVMSRNQWHIGVQECHHMYKYPYVVRLEKTFPLGQFMLHFTTFMMFLYASNNHKKLVMTCKLEFHFLSELIVTIVRKTESTKCYF